MANWKYYHWLAAAIGFAITVAIVFSGVQADRLARIGAGYKAKVACSEIFVANRDAASVIATEFEGIDPLMAHIRVRPDLQNKTVTAAGPLGFGRANAAYRDGYGCTLTNGGRLRKLPPASPPLASDPWLTATAGSREQSPYIDYAALDGAIDTAFSDNSANHRAFVVVVDGEIVAERYADGFDRRTPFLSWSMGKSVTATMVGAAALQGYVNIEDPAPAALWASDPVRSSITWHDLLQMQSGLAFEEAYDKTRSDVNRMLFEMPDAGAVAEQSPSAHIPGEAWYYSSGTTNLLSKLLRQELTAKGVDYHAFARQAIFDPIGAASIVMEPDATGVYIGSSFVYATARDWARLGQLYLQNGRWESKRLVPENWADYVKAPAAASDNQYGAHFWLNRDGDSGRNRFIPELPEDVYFMSGHEGQYVFIIPSKKMIVVRTGMTRGQSSLAAVAPLMEEVFNAVDAPSR